MKAMCIEALYNQEWNFPIQWDLNPGPRDPKSEVITYQLPGVSRDIFLISQKKITNVAGTHEKCLGEAF